MHPNTLKVNGKDQQMRNLVNLVVIIVLALSLLCAWFPTSQAVDKPALESLSANDRMEVFETVLKTINDEYYNYNPLFADWATVRERYRPRVEATKNDDEFYALLNSMLPRIAGLPHRLCRA